MLNKNILILERDHQGHRLTGVRVLLDGLLELQSEHDAIGSITIATTQAGFASPQWQEQLADVSDRISKLVLPEQTSRESTLNAAWTKVRDWRRYVCAGKFDHVYIPYGDGLIQMLAALRFVPGYLNPPKHVCVEAILMRGSFGYDTARKSTQRIALFGLRYAPIHRIHLIDPLPFEYIQKSRPILLKKVSLLPDPITPTRVLTKVEARQALDLSQASQWIGCIGVIDSRKGADKLVKAFANASLPADVKLLLAGKHSTELLQLIAHLNDPRIISIDRYLSELELNQALSALDLVATPYPDFIGSASIVLRAAAGERFCLGANTGWMKRIIPAFELGALCDVNNEQDFSRALVEALLVAQQHQPSASSHAFVRYGSIANVYAHWTDLIRQRSGIPTHQQSTAWPAQQSMEASLAKNTTEHY